MGRSRGQANGQSVSAAALAACAGVVEEPSGAHRRGARPIGQITRRPVKATGVPNAGCHIWSGREGSWSIGHLNAEALRRALARQ